MLLCVVVLLCCCVCFCLAYNNLNSTHFASHVSDMEGDAAAALLPEPSNASGTMRVGFEIPKDKIPKDFVEENSKELLRMSTKLSTILRWKKAP